MYKIELLSDYGNAIASDTRETKADAIKRAKYLLTADFAAAVESSHFALGTERARVTNPKGEIIFDKLI
jgi:hypothetical protein